MYYPLNQWKPFCNGLWISSFDQETFKNCTFIFIQCIYNSFVLFMQHPLQSRLPPALALHVAVIGKVKTKKAALAHITLWSTIWKHCVHISVDISAHKNGRGDGGTGQHSLLLSFCVWSHLQTPRAEPSAFSSVGEIVIFVPRWGFLQTQPGKEPGSLLWNWSGHKRRQFK